MSPEDRDKLLTVLAGVHDFYRQEMSDFAGEVWVNACAGHDVEQVSKALSAHLMDAERGQWMPKPADLVRQMAGTQSDRSRRAWGKVLEAAQRVGAYRSVAFDEPAIHAAVEDVGGWMSVCRTDVTNCRILSADSAQRIGPTSRRARSLAGRLRWSASMSCRTG